MTRFSTSHPLTLKFYSLWGNLVRLGSLMKNSDDLLILGDDFQWFWIDFLRDELGKQREESLNRTAAKMRSLILKTEHQGIKVQFSKFEVTVFCTFNNEPEEWVVSL